MEDALCCQFCKRSFKSLEDAQTHHIDCEGIYHEHTVPEHQKQQNELEIVEVKNGSESDNKCSDEQQRSLITACVTGEGNYVNYTLNKQSAYGKKIEACNRDAYTVELKSSCCVISLSTAAFEYFKEDLVIYLKESDYRVKEKPTIDRAGNITQDTYIVSSTATGSPYLFTINLYRTKSNGMINGANFMMFVDVDLPVLVAKLDNRESVINQVNDQFKIAIPRAKFIEEQPGQCPEIQCPELSKRNRKKKNFEGYEVQYQRKTRSSTGLSCNEDVKDELDNREQCGWDSRPKYWDNLGYGEWTQEIAKNCFEKPKGCLMQCGKNNSRDMVMCDGCGRWCHFKCMKEEVDKEVDFLCHLCKSRSLNNNLSYDLIKESVRNVEGFVPVKNAGKLLQNPPNTRENDHNMKSTDLNDMMKDGVDDKDVLESGVTNGGHNLCKRNNRKAENKNVVSKKRYAKEVIFTIENQLSWWNDGAINELRNSLSEQQYTVSNGNVNERGLVPFKAEKPNVDGIIGGEFCLTGMPRADSSVTWMEQSEIRTIQVNCAQLLKSWKNDDAKSMYQVIIKLKQKISLLKGQASHQVTCNAGDALNRVTQELEKSENKAAELKERNKKLAAENNELKSGKKNLANECKELKNSVKTKESNIEDLIKERNVLNDEISKHTKKLEELRQVDKGRNNKLLLENDSLRKKVKESSEECRKLKSSIKVKDEEVKKLSGQIKEVNGELELMRRKTTEAQQKLRIMEEVAGDVCVEENKCIKITGSSCTMCNGYDVQVKELEAKCLKLEADKSKLETVVAENAEKLKWTNESYQDIIVNKDKVILALTSLTEEGSIENKYKMLLMHYKSELELRSVQELKRKVENELQAKNSGENHNEVGQVNNSSTRKVVTNQDKIAGGKSLGAEERNADESRMNNNGLKGIDGGASSGGMHSGKSRIPADRKLMQYIKGGYDKEENNGGGNQGNGFSSSSRNKICWAFDKCVTEGCNFMHTLPNNDIMRSKKPCWFGERCSRKFCPFVHPKKRASDEILPKLPLGKGETGLCGGDMVGVGARKRTGEKRIYQSGSSREDDNSDKSISQRLTAIANSTSSSEKSKGKSDCLNATNMSNSSVDGENRMGDQFLTTSGNYGGCRLNSLPPGDDETMSAISGGLSPCGGNKDSVETGNMEELKTLHNNSYRTSLNLASESTHSGIEENGNASRGGNESCIGDRDGNYNCPPVNLYPDNERLRVGESLRGAEPFASNYLVNGMGGQQVIEFRNSWEPFEDHRYFSAANCETDGWRRPVVYVNNGTPLLSVDSRNVHNDQYSNGHTKNEMRNVGL